MAHGLEGGVERERLRTMVAMASIFLDRDTKACQFRNGVRTGPLVNLVSVSVWNGPMITTVLLHQKGPLVTN